MNIKKYEGYFHDGTLLDVYHSNKDLVFSMSSAEIDPEEMCVSFNLSKFNRIRGKLHFKNISRIIINDKIFAGTLKKECDEGDIFDLSIDNKKGTIQLEWVDYSSQLKEDKFWVIEIEAETIFWENIPELQDPLLDPYLRKKTN